MGGEETLTERWPGHQCCNESSRVCRLQTVNSASPGTWPLQHHRTHPHTKTMSGPDQNHSTEHLNGTPWYVYECTLHMETAGAYRRIALFLLYLFIFTVGLLENGLVVWVNWRRRHSANGVLFCIINVSLSDLMMIIILPFFMMEVTMDKVWLWGRFLCKVTYLFYGVNFYSSSFFLAFMTLERYLSLARPSFPAFFPAAGRRRWVLCAGLWSLSLLLALIENVHVDLMDWEQPGCYMIPENNYIEWYTAVGFLSLIFQFLGPAAVIITCNVLMARAVQTAPDVQGRRDVWLVHVYSLVFVMCWLPYHLVTILLIIDDINPYILSCNAMEIIYFSQNVVQSLSIFHCVANPILYNFLSKSFRRNLINTAVDYIPREATVRLAGPGAQPDAPKGRRTDPGKQQRRSSNVSTSQSDIGV
ncbi:G-protein coupled receptor 182 isoform 1-T2 [Spinachia spinachia]